MNKFKIAIFCMALGAMAVACSDNDDAPLCRATFADKLPEIVADGYTVTSGNAEFTEINTGTKYNCPLPAIEGISVPIGVYNVAAEMTVSVAATEYHLKATAYQVTISADNVVDLKWWLYNPQNTLVFGEVFFTGTLNAKGTNGLYDTYFTIYNNTDEVQYADGIAIAESKLLNTTTDQILTPANQRDVNFTAQTVYVIPGSGHDVPIAPGQSIKIVDQAIDWNANLAGALNHTDADFEWYDESSSASVVDTDNPSVPNLDKWYSYSPTIWLPSNQCNRSYVLVRFPSGMTMERFIAEQNGEYDYINSATGNQMHGTKCFLIKPEWIIDGFNLCPTEKFTEPVLPPTVDRGYAAISDKNSDVNRFGKKFARKVSATIDDGRRVLQDTDNSADDFEILPVK